MNTLKNIIKRLLKLRASPTAAFCSYHYQRINQRRQEHLGSLGLKIAGSTVLEVGAGIGDHTSFFLDRGCQIVSTDAREENLRILGARYQHITVTHLDLDDPGRVPWNERFDIIYCYGVLYHLKNPAKALEFMSRWCLRMFLLETCVSFGKEDMVNPCEEDLAKPTQSVSGGGCRPTRRWIYNELRRHFEFVYLPISQPYHEEFPIDWTSPPSTQSLTRAVFIGSRMQIDDERFTAEIPMVQIRE